MGYRTSSGTSTSHTAEGVFDRRCRSIDIPKRTLMKTEHVSIYADETMSVSALVFTVHVSSSTDAPTLCTLLAFVTTPHESHTEVDLDTVISEFTKLLTEYPSYYKEMSLPDTTCKMLVPIVQEIFKQLMWYDPLEQPNMKMETVSKLKYILLGDKSASLPYVGLLIELVVNHIMKWLKETWTPTRSHSRNNWYSSCTTYRQSSLMLGNSYMM